MTTGTITPYRSDVRAGRDGFGQLLRAEWTKFRTVRGWVIGMIAAAVVTVLLGLFAASGIGASCNGHACSVAVGPGGGAVTDSFYFVHRTLNGDGSITVRVTSLTGGATSDNPGGGDTAAQPWSKAGIIIKQGTRQGSAYAAMLVTGSHGVRMQYNYTGDTAGPAGAVSAASPRWLRLTRSGDTLTGYESANGRTWTRVGTVGLAGLSPAVQAGVFVSSPPYARVTSQHLFGSSGVTNGPTTATAVFDHVSTHGIGPGGAWRGQQLGGDTDLVQGGGYHQADGRFTVSGSGDIAPLVAGPATLGVTVEHVLAGAFAGLIVAVVVGAMFISAEYRRGMIRTTVTASPRRGRILVAKAIVIGAAAFVAALAATATVVPLGEGMVRRNGNVVYPVAPLTEVRVVAGTAAVFAVAAVLALAIGAILRRSAAAVTAVIVVIVLPYILARLAVLPVGAAQWLLRITPAAGFAIQQSLPQYPQVSNAYTPLNGYYPLAPWAGFAVLCGYAALALGLAIYLVRRRDA